MSGARKHPGAGLLLTFLLLALRPFPATASTVEDFYKGRSVAALIGFDSGSAYDTYVRILAKYMGRHIPGNPTIVPQNMPGAGSLKLVNYLYNVAARDGSVFGHFARAIPLEPLMGDSDAKFDARHLTWLGSVGSESSVCVTWHESKVKSWDDLLTKEVVFGATSMSADTGLYAILLKNLFGAPIKLALGYPGGNALSLAIERGEIDGRCGWSWSSIKSGEPAWLADDKINILVQEGINRIAELPNVPLVLDLVPDDRRKQVARFIYSTKLMGWPFAAPPEVPAERKAALRAAFDATMKDPGFLADAATAQLEVSPTTGAALDRVVSGLYATPTDIVTEARDMISTR